MVRKCKYKNQTYCGEEMQRQTASRLVFHNVYSLCIVCIRENLIYQNYFTRGVKEGIISWILVMSMALNWIIVVCWNCSPAVNQSELRSKDYNRPNWCLIYNLWIIDLSLGWGWAWQIKMYSFHQNHFHWFWDKSETFGHWHALQVVST